MEWLKLVHKDAPKPIVPPQIGTGDEVRIWFKILEQGKERFGQFEGTVIRTRGSGASKTLTLRRVTYGEGVERIFPMNSRTISKVEILRKGHVKRARLYYLRHVIGKTRVASTDVSMMPNTGPSRADAASAAATAAIAATEATTIEDQPAEAADTSASTG